MELAQHFDGTEESLSSKIKQSINR